MIKPWVWVLIGTGIATAIAGSIYIYLLKNQPQADFGDAPDGALAYKIDEIEIGGKFPSLEKSNGLSLKKTDEVWLGEKVDKEKDSVQVDKDFFDDGAGVKLNSCATSTAIFMIHLANPGKMTGIAYLNLFYDWNRDGKWGGQDDCAKEWAVQNYPVDLSKQDQPVMVYLPEFTAGKFDPEKTDANDFWRRFVITLDQKLIAEDGSGEFLSGEVSDYGPAIYFDDQGGGGEEGDYRVECDPNPLFLEHGQEGKIAINEMPFATLLTNLEFPNSVEVKNDVRDLSIDGDSIVYKSNQKDPPARSIQDIVDIRVNYGPPEDRKASILESCEVWVVHEDGFNNRIAQIGKADVGLGSATTQTLDTKKNESTTTSPAGTTSGTGQSSSGSPAGINAGSSSSSNNCTQGVDCPTSVTLTATPTLSAWFEHYTDYAQQGYPSVVGVYLKPTDTAGKNITNLRFDLTNIFSDPASLDFYALNINQTGDAQGWTCAAEYGSFYYNCSGPTALLANFKSIGWFYYRLMLNWPLIPSLLPFRANYSGGGVDVNAEKK